MLAEALARYLEAEGLGVVGDGGSIFIDHLPASPSEAISIIERAGRRASVSAPWDYPAIQIIVRSAEGPQVGRAAAEAVFAALHGMGGVDLDGQHVVSLQCVGSGPEPIGRDGNGRYEYSMNFESFIVTQRGQ